MGSYAITFARSARKELEALPDQAVGKIFVKIELLSDNPRPRGCHKLEGEKHLWRIRVGEYRVIYAVSDSEKVVDIIRVRHRRDAYR